MNVKASVSVFALIVANLVPLIGALFFNWDATLILALFWIENLIIGAFNLIKMFSLGVYHKDTSAFFKSVFFTFHYGAFCSVHGVILWDILGLAELDKTLYFSSESMGVLTIFTEGAVVLFAFIDKFEPQIWLGIVALLISHFVSFIEHFILRGNIFKNNAKELMMKPYVQIFILHAGLIFGAAAVEKFGSHIWLLIIIVLFKVTVDLVLHVRRHNKTQAKGRLFK